MGSAIVQFNCAVNELIARLPLTVKYRGIHLGIIILKVQRYTIIYVLYVSSESISMLKCNLF